MSDLIRKYDVLKICEEEVWNGADDYYSLSANQIAKKVKELPTDDAIPIEFIRGEIARMNQGANRYLSECATYAEDLENLIIIWERRGK